MKKACAPLPSKPSIVWSIAPCGKRRSCGNISSAIIINEKSNAQELHTTELKNVNPSMIGQNTSITAQHSAIGIVISSSVKGATLPVIHEGKSWISFMTRLINKFADETLHPMLFVLIHLQPQARQSVTFDKDITFAKHHVLAKKLKLQTWFCDPYTSWQKSCVKNTSGRIRR